jgi:cytosolic iron-sulfur protein assembly protein CIAO1
MTNEANIQDRSFDIESVKSNAVSMSYGTLLCTATLKPPLCRLSTASDATGGNDSTTITYEQKQPAWECSFSRDGTYLAVCYGAPNPCIRIYHYGIEITKKTTSSCNKNAPKNECDTDNQSYTTWQNTNLQSQTNRAASLPTKYSWQLQSTLDGVQSRTIRSVRFAPISRPLVIASASFDGTIAIWEQQLNGTTRSSTSTKEEVVEWECTTELQGHENEVKCVRWNATGSLLATCGRDKTIWIWEAYLPGTIGGGPVVSSMGHKQLEAPTVTTSSFECISVLNGHEGDVKHVEFANSHEQFGDGSEILLSASYDETIRIWAEEDGDWYCALSIASVHTSTIWTIAVAPSATRFISGSADQSLAIYKCFTPEELQQRGAISGQQGATSRKKATWECVGKLPNAHSSTIYCVDYAPARASHGRIVSCGSDNRIQIYREVSNSTPEQPLFAIDASVVVPTGGDINCVQWHPYDGSVLVSTSDDGSVRIWNYTM